MAFTEKTTTEQGKQPYMYNGKKLDQSHGLNPYDYSAKYYDNAKNKFEQFSDINTTFKFAELFITLVSITTTTCYTSKDIINYFLLLISSY